MPTSKRRRASRASNLPNPQPDMVTAQSPKVFRGMQPAFDQPLACGVTPNEIIHSIFVGSTSAQTCFTSSIVEECVNEQLLAINKRTGYSARWAWSEYECEHDCMVEYAVELHIDDVYITGIWLMPCGSLADDERGKASSEAAFITASALIGKRVQRMLVVDED